MSSGALRAGTAWFDHETVIFPNGVTLGHAQCAPNTQSNDKNNCHSAIVTVISIDTARH